MDETLTNDNENTTTPTGIAEAGASETGLAETDLPGTGNPEGGVQKGGGKGTRWTPLIIVAAWFVPGLGHALLGRWGRALAFFGAVGGLAITGYLMRGQVFPPNSDDPFGTVGFLADAASGVFFLVAHFFEAAGPEIGRAAGDYGTRFIAAAGIVNVLGVFDAYEIARGRRS
jgi:hypothetical protein